VDLWFRTMRQSAEFLRRDLGSLAKSRHMDRDAGPKTAVLSSFHSGCR
jgi:hypothetical protein